jgi:hypothetical protein
MSGTAKAAAHRAMTVRPPTTIVGFVPAGAAIEVARASACCGTSRPSVVSHCPKANEGAVDRSQDRELHRRAPTPPGRRRAPGSSGRAGRERAHGGHFRRRPGGSGLAAVRRRAPAVRRRARGFTGVRQLRWVGKRARPARLQHMVVNDGFAPAGSAIPSLTADTEANDGVVRPSPAIPLLTADTGANDGIVPPSPAIPSLSAVRRPQPDLPLNAPLKFASGAGTQRAGAAHAFSTSRR